MAAANNRAFVRKQERPHAKLQLFCFTFAGSSAQVFHGWSDYAPDWLEVSGFELPGHGPRMHEKALDAHPEAAVSIADTLEGKLDRPYAIFGHCLGAALGYEATRILRSRGAPQPVHFFACGARGPHYGIPIADVESMEDDEFIQHLSETYAAPTEFLNHPEMRPLFLPMVRADARMTQNYRYTPGRPMDYEITAIAGEEDPYVQLEHLEGWRLHTTSKVTTRFYPGDHFFFMESAARLIEDFSKALQNQV